MSVVNSSFGEVVLNVCKSYADDKMSSVSNIGAKEVLLVNLFVNPNVAAYQGCSLVVFPQDVASEEIVDMSCEGT